MLMDNSKLRKQLSTIIEVEDEYLLSLSKHPSTNTN